MQHPKGYLAPEMLQRQTYSKTIDVWALGVIVFVLLCGCLPFDDDAGRVSAESVRRLLKSPLSLLYPSVLPRTPTTNQSTNTTNPNACTLTTPKPNLKITNRCPSASSCASPPGPATSPRGRKTYCVTSSVRINNDIACIYIYICA